MLYIKTANYAMQEGSFLLKPILTFLAKSNIVLNVQALTNDVFAKLDTNGFLSLAIRLGLN